MNETDLKCLNPQHISLIRFFLSLFSGYKWLRSQRNYGQNLELLLIRLIRSCSFDPLLRSLLPEAYRIRFGRI